MENTQDNYDIYYNLEIKNNWIISQIKQCKKKRADL